VRRVKGTELQREINPPGNWIAPPNGNRSRACRQPGLKSTETVRVSPSDLNAHSVSERYGDFPNRDFVL
jgi:hypothetical protein